MRLHMCAAGVWRFYEMHGLSGLAVILAVVHHGLGR